MKKLKILPGYSACEFWPPRAAQVWTINDDHSGYRAVGDVLCWLNSTLHGDALASWFVPKCLRSTGSIFLPSLSSLSWTSDLLLASEHFTSKREHFSHHAPFIFECLLIIVIIHFQTFKTSTHKHTLSCSLPRIKDIWDPSTPSNAHLVLGSLIQQILINYLYIQADTSLPSHRAYILEVHIKTLTLFSPNWHSFHHRVPFKDIWII